MADNQSCDLNYRFRLVVYSVCIWSGAIVPFPFQISFDIDQNLCDKASEDKSQCPSNHDMRLGTLAGPNRALAVYSEGEEVS